jgi:hypothetical protein
VLALLLAVIAGCGGERGGPASESFEGCPAEGSAHNHDAQFLNTLKNRSALTTADDVDPRVTLDALLAPGTDRRRWDWHRAATIEGWVVSVKMGSIETCNCRASDPRLRDTHITLAPAPDAPATQHVIVEVTPRWRAWAARRGLDWSTVGLRRALYRHRVRVTGWLLFDREHLAESENTAPGRFDNWRGTAWELHPVTAITVLSPRWRAPVAARGAATPYGVAPIRDRARGGTPSPRSQVPEGHGVAGFVPRWGVASMQRACTGAPATAHAASLRHNPDLIHA